MTSVEILGDLETLIRVMLEARHQGAPKHSALDWGGILVQKNTKSSRDIDLPQSAGFIHMLLYKNCGCTLSFLAPV
jgi:hypothetical protein